MTSVTRQVTDLNGARHVLTRQLGRGGKEPSSRSRADDWPPKSSSIHRRPDASNFGTSSAVKRLPLADLEIARPLEMLREPVLGYLMELLTGMQPLSALCNPPKATTSVAAWYFQTGGLRRRLALLARTADVLSALHGKGLVLSDPSPHNIFVSEASDATEVRFIDSDNIHYASSAGLPRYSLLAMVRLNSSAAHRVRLTHRCACVCCTQLSDPVPGSPVNRRCRRERTA